MDRFAKAKPGTAEWEKITTNSNGEHKLADTLSSACRIHHPVRERSSQVGGDDVSSCSANTKNVMSAIISNIKVIMLISGVLTATMIYAAIAPAAALQSNFGESLHGPLAELIVRNWGILIALVGGMLIYGAFDLGSRRMALLVAGASKVAFIVLVLAHGSKYFATGAGIAVVFDAVMVLLFAVYLSGSWSSPESAPIVRVSSRIHDSKEKR